MHGMIYTSDGWRLKPVITMHGAPKILLKRNGKDERLLIVSDVHSFVCACVLF